MLSATAAKNDSSLFIDSATSLANSRHHPTSISKQWLAGYNHCARRTKARQKGTFDTGCTVAVSGEPETELGNDKEVFFMLACAQGESPAVTLRTDDTGFQNRLRSSLASMSPAIRFQSFPRCTTTWGVYQPITMVRWLLSGMEIPMPSYLA